MAKKLTDYQKQILKRVKAKVSIDPVNNCWNWTGSYGGGGYGVIVINQKRYTVRRLVYAVLKEGGMTYSLQGEQVRATCDNPHCVNPAHLVLNSQKVNGIYPWVEWFDKPKRTKKGSTATMLVRGKHFTCTTASLAQQARNAAVRLNRKISVNISGDVVIIDRKYEDK